MCKTKSTKIETKNRFYLDRALSFFFSECFLYSCSFTVQFAQVKKVYSRKISEDGTAEIDMLSWNADLSVNKTGFFGFLSSNLNGAKIVCSKCRTLRSILSQTRILYLRKKKWRGCAVFTIHIELQYVLINIFNLLHSCARKRLEKQ